MLQSGVLDDEPEHRGPLLGEEQVSTEDGSVVRDVKGMAAPRQPSRDEVTSTQHYAFAPNSHHRTSKHWASRSIPVFVADFCFVRQPNEDLLTGLVGKLYPSHCHFQFCLRRQRSPGRCCESPRRISEEQRRH